MSQQEIALKKLREELKKDIAYANEIAKKCGLNELLCCLVQLHWVRLLDKMPNTLGSNPEKVEIYSTSTEEAYKYVISMIAKFGTGKANFKLGSAQRTVRIDEVNRLVKQCMYINSKYETESFIQLFDVQVSGERNQNFRIDMGKMDTDAETKILYNYGLRVDDDNDAKKREKLTIEKLLALFQEDYKSVGRLFELELGISLDEFCWLIKFLLNQITVTIQTNEQRYDYLANGNVNIQSQKTMFAFAQAYQFIEKELKRNLEPKFYPILEKLIFKNEAFNPEQLRFHQISRQPIIRNKGVLLISPELLMDSLSLNIHYTLLESSTKQNYIATQANAYIDQLVAIANKYNYSEVERERELYEGKNQIGDIDLVLRGSSGNYLLIEAKNHVLPLDVYFKDVEKTKEHLRYLQKNWEKKVVRRVEHLKMNHNAYGIPNDYQYIVVSKFPEIISHYSELFVLSISEFEQWLRDFPELNSFETFYKATYGKKEFTLTESDLLQMSKDNLFFGTFAKE